MPGNPFTDPNWAADLADTIERTVGNVREKTTKPLVTVTRGLVYGLLAAIMGVAAVVFLINFLIRGIQALLDLLVSTERAVYLSYLIIGLIFAVAGMLALRKRHPSTS